MLTHASTSIAATELTDEILASWGQAYLRFLKVKRRSAKHQERVGLSLFHFGNWLKTVEEQLLTQELIEDYALYLMEEARPHAGTAREGAPGSLSVASQRGYLIDLRSFLRWLSDRGHVPLQAKHWVPVPPPSKHGVKRAQNADIRRILQAAQQDLRDYALCCLLIDCGLRAGELGSLRIENCNLPHRTLMVTGKTGVRTVAISNHAASVLNQWIALRSDEEGFVFPGRKSGHLSTNGVYQIMVRLRNRAQVKGRINPHSWRHAYISNTVVRGGNAALTQVQAGHSSIATTEEYFSFGIAELRDYQERVTVLPDLAGDIPMPKSTAGKVLPKPNQDELMAAITDCPNWEALGRKYGVTGAAVKKWAKRWQLTDLYDYLKHG